MSESYQDLSKFEVPRGFRGRNLFSVQLWWLVQSTLFKYSPQVMYGWRRLLLRAFGARIGKQVLIRPSVKVTYPWKLTVGDFSWIGDNVDLYTLGEIVIGNNSVISQKSYLCTGTHDYSRVDFDIVADPIKVGNGVWIASDVFVHPGVSINDNVVVSARSTVTSDLSEGYIYKGFPAVLVKSRFSNEL